MVVVAALIASLAFTTLAQPEPASAAPEATVSGKVFQTFNTSGWQTEAAEGKPGSAPVRGVTVTAFDAEGDVVGTAKSGANGAYTVPVADAFSNALRVEFSDWAKELEPAFAAQGSPPRTGAAANDTSVQFVTLDAAGEASDVDFGLFEPEDTIQDDAPIATPIQSAGSTTESSKDLPALVAQPWSMTGESPDLSQLGSFGEIGSVWGTAYARLTNELYAAATLKRMSGVGPLGIGGLYRTTNVLRVDGTLNPDAHVEPWFSFDGLPISNASETLDIGASKVPTNDERGLGEPGTPIPERAAFKLAARVGLGGIATSPDGRRLFVTNLADGQVYASDISQGVAPTAVNRVKTKVDQEHQSVWALSIYRDRLYVGYVDTGDKMAATKEDPIPKRTATPGYAAKSKGMHAYVDSVPLAEVTDGLLDETLWRQEIKVDLGYAKGTNLEGWVSDKPGTGPGGKALVSTVYPQVRQWNTWTDDWRFNTNNGWKEVGIKGGQKSADIQAYPQAILSGIAFDSKGYMNLGFTDRNSVQSGNRSRATIDRYGIKPWTAISNGDLLVAAPAALWEPGVTKPCLTGPPAGNYVLECGGKVGDREVRETPFKQDPADPAETPQKVTYNNGDGPGLGEFYNDRRSIGTGIVHDEVALGSVVAYPGLSGVATTAIDPLDSLYRAGLMWFDERSGVATRGVELSVASPGEYTASFQKAGGLGGVTMLALAAPVEIGNRVWLDADLNGRQDADEPAINGAEVELWTAGENGEPVALVGTRTTKTIDGQGGTYYFRSDDPDMLAEANPNPLVKERPYVLIFNKGKKLALTGPNARNAGFAGMNWESLERTVATAHQDATPGYGGTTEINDSNPDPATGQAQIRVRGSGENDHSFDSGWFAASTYSVQKNFSPSSTRPTPGTEFTFTVVNAHNFRGQERLEMSGAPAQNDPEVAANGPTAAAPSWVATSDQRLPAGYQLELEEVGAKQTNMTWANPVAGNPLRGSVLMTPVTQDDPTVTVNITNEVGQFTVKKVVSGQAASQIQPNTKFQIEYRLNGGEVRTGWTSVAAPLVVDGVPLDTKVSVRESTPIVTDPVVTSVEWGVPTWSQTPGLGDPDADGWREFTLDRQARDFSMTLRNYAEPRLGALSITKIRDENEPDATRKFSFEYRVGADGATRPLGPIAPGKIATTSKTIPAGATVLVREVPLPEETNIHWAQPEWSGLPAGAIGPDAAGWYSFVFDPDAASARVELSAKNSGIEKPAKFSVMKSVTAWPGTPAPIRDTFDFVYRIAPAPVGGVAPVFADPVPFQVKTGELWGSPAVPQGSILEVREIQPEDTAGTFWAPPVWSSTSGQPLTQVDGWTRVSVNSADTIEFALDNRTEEPTTFSLRKVLEGTGTSHLDQVTFDVEMQIGTAATQTIQLKADGERWVSPVALPADTVVKLREVMPTVPNFEWGTPEWSAAGGVTLTEENGWTVFSTSAQSPAVAVTLKNKPSHEAGQFQFKKTLKVSGNPELPADYQFEYRIGADAVKQLTLKAGETSPLFDNIAFGTKVQIRELGLSNTADQTWSRAWKLNGAKATEGSDGWVNFEIVNKETVTVDITNSTKEQFGGFRVAKAISGDGASLVPGDTKFVFEYTLDGGAVQTVTATPDEISETIGNLQIGTVVTIEEGPFPVVPGVKFGGTPTWTVDGVTATSPVKFTVTNDTLIELGVDNSTTPTVGEFQVTKSLTGDAKGRVPAGAKFQVEYSVDNGSTWKKLPVMTAANLTANGPKLRVGTQVLLRELEPEGGTGFEWGNPVFSIGSSVQGTMARFEIEQDAQVVAVALANPVKPRDGRFEIVKRLEGDFDLHDTEFSKVTFDVLWTGGGRSGTVHLSQANNWVAGPQIDFPEDTEITLTEADVKGLPSYVEWNQARWADDTPGVTVSPDGATATLMVAAKKTAHLELTNKFSEEEGTFEVEKRIVGDFNRNSPELESRAFKVYYVTSDGAKGVLSLDKRGDWKAKAARDFRVGTKVELTEVPVDQSSLPDNMKWGGYTWVASSNYDVSADGLTASFTVTKDANVQLALENRFDEPEDGSFSVSKKIAGDVQLTDPALGSQAFVVNYATEAGETGTLKLDSKNGWNEVSKTFKVGTKVTLTEAVPSGLHSSIKWADHKWLPAAGVAVSDDHHSATFTVAPTGKVLELTLENTFDTPKPHGFGVEKVVTGDLTLDAPELVDMAIFVEYQADNGKSGKLKLDAAGAWKAKLKDLLPVGTKVTLKESKVEGLPAAVVWKSSRWLPGEGYTVSKDQRTAHLAIVDREAKPEAEPQLVLENRLEYAYGAFNLTKRVEGAGAADVPNDMSFIAEYSIDDGATWLELPAMTKAAPKVAGPAKLPLGTNVLIRERAPEQVPGHTWAAPVFSGTGVTAGAGDAPASFVITHSDTPLEVALTNSTEDRGQFTLTKQISGAGVDALKRAKPTFTVRYTYEGQKAPGEFTLGVGETFSSEALPIGTRVTITELAPSGELPKDLKWGTPALVLPDGSVFESGATFTIADSAAPLRILLENPLSLPETGASSNGFVPVVGGVLLAIGAGLLITGLRARRKRKLA